MKILLWLLWDRFGRVMMHSRMLVARAHAAAVWPSLLLFGALTVQAQAFRTPSMPWRAGTALGLSPLRINVRDRYVWPRLNEITQKIPDSARVADIGCDHGLLAVVLAEQRPNAQVIGIDRSDAAIHQASRNFHKHRLTNVQSLRVGEGLTALSSGEADTLVFAGMGSHTIFTVITNQAPSHAVGLTPESISTFGLQPLDRLGVKRVIMQPSPLNAVSVQLLRCAMLSHGWDYEQESMLRAGQYMYLTTSWVRKQGDSGKYQPVSLLQAMVRSPLNGRYMRGESSDTERELYTFFFDHSIASLTHTILQATLHNSQRDLRVQQETLDVLTRIRQTVQKVQGNDSSGKSAG